MSLQQSSIRFKLQGVADADRDAFLKRLGSTQQDSSGWFRWILVLGPEDKPAVDQFAEAAQEHFGENWRESVLVRD